MALSSLDLPQDTTEILQELAFDMRSDCMVILLKQAIEGEIVYSCSAENMKNCALHVSRVDIA